MAWKSFYGDYMRSGAPFNVVLGGAPGNSGPFGVNLKTAHNAGYGYGINFIDNGNYSVTFQLNLIGYAVQDNRTWVPSSPSYSQYGGTYNYKITIQTSSDGGKTYNKTIVKKQIFVHGDTWGMYANGSWKTTAKNSQWKGTFKIPQNTTHVKILLQGDDNQWPQPNIYPITEIITEARPWAVRKNKKFLSVNRASGWFKIRKSGAWSAKLPAFQGGIANKGNSRIRHGNTWYGQSKVGE